MFAPTNNSSFRFELPKFFIPKELEEKYLPYIERFNTPFKNVNSFVNATVKDFTFSSLSYSPVSQNRRFDGLVNQSTEFKYRASTGTNNLFESKDFTIKFSAVDGFINYFILMETFLYYYNFRNKIDYTPDFIFKIIDNNNVVTMEGAFRKILFTGLESLSFSYGELESDFAEFTCNFQYSIMDLNLEIFRNNKNFLK